MSEHSFADQETMYMGLFENKLTQEQYDNIITWIEALESGKYAQGKEKLRDGCYYCCLGVANEVCHLRNSWEEGVSLRNNRKKVGLRDSEGEFNMNPSSWAYFSRLTSLNDHKDWSFVEIAKLLRDQLNLSTIKVEKKQ